MFAPANRLLWLTFGLMTPVLTMAGMIPSAWMFTVLFVVAFASALAWDAYRLNALLSLVKVTAGEAVSAYRQRASEVTFSVEMPAPLAEADVAFEWPESFAVDQLVTRVSAAVTASFTPGERGEFVIQGAYIQSPSPWRLWTMRVRRPIHLQVKVFPELRKDPAARKVFATFQQGQRVQRTVGRGREVERLRDYAPGDSFDEVYWKGTARRGAPISKVFQVERTQDVYAVVDGSRLGNRNQALERFVTASLLLALTAAKNSDNFGLVTFDSQVRDFVRASHGKGHFHRCREAIFDLQPAAISPDFAELFTFLNLRIRKRALLFFLTDLSDPLLAETFARDAAFVARRHIVIVNQVADEQDRALFTGSLPETDADVRKRLAGHLQWAKLRELERSLSRIGIKMHLLQAEQTSTDLIAQYEKVKQRQLL